MWRKVIIIFTFVFLLNIFFSQKTLATTISPVKYVITASPGSNNNVNLKIRNDELENINYNIFVLGAKQDEKSFAPVFLNGISEAESWVSPEVEQLSIAPGEEKNVNFKINIPIQAYPGAYYLGLAVQKRSLAEAKVQLAGRLIAILNLQVAGEAREVLQIKNFFYKKNLNNAKNVLPFYLELKNQGNVELPVKGQIKILNWQKKEISSQEVYLGNNLLPDSSRSLFLVFNKDLSWSPYYWAEIVINYGRTKQVVQKMVFVNNLPIIYLGLLLLVLFSLFLIIVKRKKKNV